MLSLDIARQIDSGNPGNLPGKDLKLSCAASGSLPDAAVFQVRRFDMPCRIVGSIERDLGPALVPGGLGPVPGLMIPLAAARRIS